MNQEIQIAAIGKIHGENIEVLPQDLYIPPDALEIYLEAFEGPLDLLLYLIRKHNLDILDIPMADLTIQYMDYVEKMKEIKLELAADYLLMSAVLIEIKSRMLLPKRAAEVDTEQDPRAELVRRLMEYELIKIASEKLTQMPQVGVDLYVANGYFEKITEMTYPDVSIDEIFSAWKYILNRAKHFEVHKVARNELSVREHMTMILRKLQKEEFVEFSSLFNVAEDRVQKLVVCFLAILELARERLIKITQQESFSPIYIKLQIN